MESEGNESGVSGYAPEFGAIFMSNNATKEECFRRKLLGLPSGQAHFVKQVKAGMLLFLFEFERRKLYGVFQAASDGAMNIVPYAFSSSGKQFPAQVRFTCLWHCTPLSEDEFSDAIRENYFSTKKFNFGLSEDQVHKLLYLFSLRKLKPQRHFSRHSTKKSRRAADDEWSKLSNKVKDELDCDSSHGSAISTHYFGAYLSKGGADSSVRKISTNYFGTRLSEGGADSSVHNQFKPSSTIYHPMELQVLKLLCPTSNENAIGSLPYDPDDPSINSRLSLSHDIVPPHSGNPGNIPSSGNQSFPAYEVPQGTRRFAYSNTGLGNSISVPSPNRYENSWRSTKPLLETSYSDDREPNSSENEGYRGSSVSRPFSAPVCFSDGGNVDRKIEGPHSFSPYQYPSFVLGYEHHGASQEKDHKMAQCGINDSFLANVPMSRDGQSELQGGLYSVEFKSIDQHVNSSLKPNGCHNSESSTKPLLETSYSDDREPNSSENEGYKGSSVPRPFSAPVCFSDGGSVDRKIEGPHSFSPYQYPSFVLGYEHHGASQEKDHKMAQCGINDSFLANVPMSKDGQSELQDGLYSVEFKSTDQHVNSSLKPNGCHNSASMYSDFQKKRESVFSRLTLASEAHNEENGSQGDDIETSVNEVMSMLHHSHGQWLMKKQTFVNSKPFKHRFQKISKDLKGDDIPASEGNFEFAEVTTFVDFRRRSEVQKVHNETGGFNGCLESEGFSGGLRKRRKLIRPNFSNVLPDDKNVSVETQNVERLHISGQDSHEDKDVIKVETVLNCKGEEKGETCGA